MRKIAIMNGKGGTGKTMTAAALGETFARNGLRVLLMDADPQNDISSQFGTPDRSNMADLLTGIPAAVIVHTGVERVDIVPSGYDLYGLELQATNGVKVDLYAIDKLLTARADAYDVAIIDCPPHFTPSSVAALIAADVILVPTTADRHAINGMAYLLDQINSLKGNDSAIKAGGIFLTMWKNEPLFREVEKTITANGWTMLKAHIRHSPKAMESTYATGHAVTDYSERSSAAKDYQQLACELLRKWGCKK